MMTVPRLAASGSELPIAETAVPGIGREHQSIALGGGAVLIASVLGNGLSYVFGVFLARWLGQAEFGVYALGLTIFNAVLLTILFGLDTGVIKFVSQYLGLGRTALARSVVVQAVLLVFLFGLIAGVALMVCAEPLARSFFHKPELAPVLRWFGIAVPLAAVVALFVATLQAFRATGWMLAIKYAWEPAGKFALAAVALWAGLGIEGLLGAIVLTLCVSIAIGLTAVARAADFQFNSIYTWNGQDLRALAAFCLPLTVANLFGVVAPRSDLLILGYWASSEVVGTYLAAFQTAAMLALVLGAFDITLAPLVGRAWAQHDRSQLLRIYREGTRLVVSVTIPLCLVMVFWGDKILQIFGREFVVGAICLAILAVGQLVNSGTALANTVLLMTGHSRQVMITTVLFGLLLIMATLLLVPLWGLVGAAVAASGCLAAMNLARVVQVWRLFRMQPWEWALMKPIAAGVGAAGVTWPITGVSEGVFFALPAAFLCLMYSGLLFLFGLEPGDKDVFSTIFGRLRLRTWG